MATMTRPVLDTSSRTVRDPLRVAFFWLSAFYVVYCVRPEDWIPGLKFFPLAKITGICAFVALISSINKAKRSFRHLPREGYYLLSIICIMYASALLSPVWKGGALMRTIDFS